MPPLEARIEQAAALADHPRIDVTGFESVIGAKYSCDTIRWLLNEAPGTHFVWIMGADNLKDFHRWKNWRDIFLMLPVAVVDRGGLSLKAASGPAAISFARVAASREQGIHPARPAAAGLGLPARRQIRPVLDRHPGGQGTRPKPIRNAMTVESIYATCLHLRVLSPHICRAQRQKERIP